MVRVVVAPSLAAVARNDGAVTTITVTAQGGRPGEVVVAYRRQGNQLVKVGSAALDERGAAVITVPTPRRTARFVLRLPATGQHGRGQTTLVVGSARTVDPEAEPTSSQ